MFIRSKILFLYLIAMFLATGISAQKVNIDSLKQVLKTVPTDTGRVNLLNEIAYEYVSSDSEQATKYATEALKRSEEIRYEFGILCAYNNLGLSEYYQNRYDQALVYYNKSKDIASKTGNRTKLSVSLNNIGLVYDDKADYKNALTYYLKALEIVDTIGGSKRQLASTLNNVGLIYQNLKNYDQALDYYRRSLKIKEEIGNKKGAGSSLHNIGLIYKLKGEYNKSLEYYERALVLRKESNDVPGTALTLNNIGSVYESKNEFDKSLPYFLEAMALRKNLKDKYSLAITLFSLGSNYYNLKQPDKGFEYFNQALEIAKSLNAKDLLKYGYEELSHSYAKEKNFSKAYEYQTLLLNIKDSILNSETTQQINELQAKYESDKKQKEIELLNKNSQIQELEINKNKLWMILLSVAILLIIALAGLFYNRSKLKQRANLLLEHRNIEITQQKKEITDSINYAKRIQESILPPVEAWNKLLPDSFIFYRPKDIVSGDFYWIEQKDDVVCFAAVDCTGHGVPGALMSVVGFNLLTQAVNEMNLFKPSEILKHLDAGVTKTLRQSEDGKGVKDGMDLSICSLNMNTLELQYAGAFNSLYYISNGIFHEIKADKFPIGVNVGGVVDDYTNHIVQLKKGDCVYLYSDGYADQFGGPKGKKFKYNQLKEMLSSVYNLPVSEQREMIGKAFDNWKGGLEQIDDVVIIGVRV